MHELGKSAALGSPVIGEPLLSLEETLRQITYVKRGHSPRHAMQSAIALREEITPFLLDEVALAPVDVEARYAAEPDDTKAYYLHTFAFYLLAYFRDERAYHLLLDYFASDADLAEELSGDELGGQLAALLVRSYDGSDLGRLRLMIGTSAFEPTFRYECLRAYHGLALIGRIDREQVVAHVRAMLDAIPEDATYDPFYPWLALAAAELRELSLRPAIEALFDRGLTVPKDSPFLVCSKEDIASIYARPEKSVRRDILQENFFASFVDRVCRWWWFTKPEPRDAAARALAAFEHDLPYMRTEPKVGRNDPCPCGSGKKYKKCCLN